MRVRIALTLVGLLAPLGAVSLAPATSYADGSGTVVVKDRVGDVSIPRPKHPAVHLSATQKRSIDIKQVTFKPVGHDVRITVALRKVIITRRFDQVVHVVWRETAGSDPWVGSVYADSRRRYDGASYDDPDSGEGESCDVPTAVSTRYNAVAVTVPYRCVPVGPLRVSVAAFTGLAASDAPLASRDVVQVPGRPTFDAG